MSDIRQDNGSVTLETAVCECGKALSECACANGEECDCGGECERKSQAQVVTISQIGDAVTTPAGSEPTSL